MCHLTAAPAQRAVASTAVSWGRHECARDRSATRPTDELLDGLNPQQRQAVLHEGSPLLIVAGAGSGKTAVLTRRIAYLLAARDVGVGPGAGHHVHQQGRRRDARAGGRAGRPARPQSMWVSTFHSTCVRILRNQASLLPGLNSNFSIYDADDSRRLLLMIGKDMGLDTKRYSPRLLANGDLQPEERADRPGAGGRGGVGGRRGSGPHRRRGLRRVPAPAARGQRAGLRRPDRRDSRCAASLSADRPVLPAAVPAHPRRRVPGHQPRPVRAGARARRHGDDRTTDAVPPAELCVVGDADQSIYAFRGATIRNIEDFERDFPNATTILLEQNYRSTQNILTAANSVIARNAGRREKRLWTDAGDGELIVGYVADNEHDEARFVAEEIDALADRRRDHLQRRRGVLPHQQLVARARRGLHPGRHPVQSRWRRSLLRAQGDPRHRRLPAGAGQPRRRGEHAAHPEHPAARHR